MGKILAFLVILVIIAAIVYVLLGNFGSFFGKDGDGGDGDSGDNGTAVSAVEDENSEQGEPIGESEENGGGEAIEYADMTVTGSAYIFGGDVTELEAFVEALDSMDENVIVRITDDGATQNAMEDLKKALEDKGRKFVIK